MTAELSDVDLAQIEAIGAPVPGFYLQGDDGQPWPEKVWCRPCAQAAAFHYRRRRGMRGLGLSECWAGDDSPKSCVGCGKLLDTGGLTDAGVCEALAHYDAYPPSDRADLPFLLMILEAMEVDNQRRADVVAWIRVLFGDLPAGAVRPLDTDSAVEWRRYASSLSERDLDRELTAAERRGCERARKALLKARKPSTLEGWSKVIASKGAP